MEEKELIQSARKGNLEAFNDLILDYQDRVYNLAYYVLLDAQAAEDTTQKAFISAFQNIRQFKGGSFQAWLLRLVVNLCDKELRREHHPTVGPSGLKKPDPNEIEMAWGLAYNAESFVEWFDQAECGERLLRCLNQLPSMVRIAVVLVDVQRLDFLDAAAVLGVSVKLFKNYLALGRMRMMQGSYPYKRKTNVNWRSVTDS